MARANVDITRKYTNAKPPALPHGSGFGDGPDAQNNGAENNRSHHHPDATNASPSGLSEAEDPSLPPNTSPTIIPSPTATPDADDATSRRNGLYSGGRFCGKRYIFAACEYQLLAGKNRQFDLAK
jgi:hypothetical protein